MDKNWIQDKKYQKKNCCLIAYEMINGKGECVCAGDILAVLHGLTTMIRKFASLTKVDVSKVLADIEYCNKAVEEIEIAHPIKGELKRGYDNERDTAAELVKVQSELRDKENRILYLENVLSESKKRYEKAIAEKDKAIQKLSKDNIKLDHEVNKWIKLYNERT